MFAAWFGVQPRQVARWESGQRMNWSNQVRLVQLLQEPKVRSALREAGVDSKAVLEEAGAGTELLVGQQAGVGTA